MMVHRVKRFAFVSAGLVFPATLSAQAFGLNEIGSCAVGRAFAATASPCRDASTIFWNSAAATQLTGWNVIVGAAAVSLQGSFKQDTTRRVFESNVPTEYVPHAFVNYHKANSKLAYGLGVYVPYGLTTQWNDDFPGRFVALRASLQTVYVQPNVAWQINSKWSIGGGPIWGHSSVELRQALDLSEQETGIPNVTFANLGFQRETEFGRAKLKGSANAFGAQIAVVGQPARGWSVGLRFLSPLKFEYDDADATFSQVSTGLIVGATLPGTPFQAGRSVDSILAPQFTSGALIAQKASTKITHPPQIQGGVAYSGLKNWLLEADVAWVGWKRFNELPLSFSTSQQLDRVLIEDYHNSTAIRLAAEYTIPTDGWKLRTGYSGVQSAAPDETVTPLLPEQDRAYWTFGATVPFGKTYSLDAGYAHVFTPGERGRIVERRSREQTAAQLNTGVFTLTANVISLSVKASF